MIYLVTEVHTLLLLLKIRKTTNIIYLFTHDVSTSCKLSFVVVWHSGGKYHNSCGILNKSNSQLKAGSLNIVGVVVNMSKQDREKTGVNKLNILCL